MKTYTEAQLNEVLRNHKHWLMHDCDGWENMRADLYKADLYKADLYKADLTGADLTGADLYKADLTGADLYKASLYKADLTGADLYKANLTGANLTGADLTGADLTGAKNTPFIPMACPDTGSFTAWKKAGYYIVRLLVTADAKRSSATGRKCRCDKAIVTAIQNLDGTESGVDSVFSDRDKTFIYKLNELASVPDFCEDRFQECAAGIHFFVNRQEAVNYNN